MSRNEEAQKVAMDFRNRYFLRKLWKITLMKVVFVLLVVNVLKE